MTYKQQAFISQKSRGSKYDIRVPAWSWKGPLDSVLDMNLDSANCWVTLGRLPYFSDWSFSHSYNEGSSTYLLGLLGDDTHGHVCATYDSQHMVGTPFLTKLHSTIQIPAYYGSQLQATESTPASLTRKELD